MFKGSISVSSQLRGSLDLSKPRELESRCTNRLSAATRHWDCGDRIFSAVTGTSRGGASVFRTSPQKVRIYMGLSQELRLATEGRNLLYIAQSQGLSTTRRQIKKAPVHKGRGRVAVLIVIKAGRRLNVGICPAPCLSGGGAPRWGRLFGRNVQGIAISSGFSSGAQPSRRGSAGAAGRSARVCLPACSTSRSSRCSWARLQERLRPDGSSP